MLRWSLKIPKINELSIHVPVVWTGFLNYLHKWPVIFTDKMTSSAPASRVVTVKNIRVLERTVMDLRKIRSDPIVDFSHSGLYSLLYYLLDLVYCQSCLLIKTKNTLIWASYYLGFINFNNDSSLVAKNYNFVLFVKKKQISLVFLLVKMILKLIWGKIITK